MLRRTTALLTLAMSAACSQSGSTTGSAPSADAGVHGTSSSASTMVTPSSSALPSSSTATSASPASSESAATSSATSTESPSSSAVAPSSSAASPSSSAMEMIELVDHPTFTEHIRPLLSRRCWQCHGTSQCFGAPMPLVTYANTQTMVSPGVNMDDRMLARVTAPNNTMPPGFPLGNVEQELLRRWIDQGSVEGPDTPQAPTPPADCNHDEPMGGPPPTLEVRAHANGTTAPWSVPADQDGNVYTCFGFTVPEGPEMHITRFQPLIDNAAVVHHIVLYKDQDPNQSPSPDDGFGCGDNDGNMQADWGFQYGWAPGTSGLVFPDDVGMPLVPGTRLVLQMHYHPIAGVPLDDASGVRIFATTELRPNIAGMVAMGPRDFTATQAMPTVSGTCSLPIRYMGFELPFDGTRIFAAFPHMHQHGVSIQAEHIRNGMTLETFGKVDAWSFDSQPNLPVDIDVQRGDSIKVSCTYGDYSNGDVRFGEQTEREMCFEFLYTTPPIQVLGYDVSFCPF